MGCVFSPLTIKSRNDWITDIILQTLDELHILYESYNEIL